MTCNLRKTFVNWHDSKCDLLNDLDRTNMINEGKSSGNLPLFAFHGCQLAPVSVMRRMSDGYTDSEEQYTFFVNPELAAIWYNFVRFSGGESYIRKAWIRKVQLYITNQHKKFHKKSLINGVSYHQICLKGFSNHYIGTSFTDE